MKKLLITAAVAAAMGAAGFLVAPAHAEPSQACAGGPGGIISNPGAPGSTSGGISICVTQGPVTGNVTAAGNAAPPGGYVVADGDSTNPGASSGYVGIQGSTGGLAVVGCATGNFAPGGSSLPDANGNSDHTIVGVGPGGATTPTPGSPNACSVPGAPF